MRIANVLGLLIGLSLINPLHPAFAIDVEIPDDACHFTGPAWDCDLVVLFDRGEVDVLADPAVQAVVYQQIVASIEPPYGEIVALYVSERLQNIIDGAGPGGSRVQITIRDGEILQLFDVFGR